MEVEEIMSSWRDHAVLTMSPRLAQIRLEAAGLTHAP